MHPNSTPSIISKISSDAFFPIIQAPINFPFFLLNNILVIPLVEFIDKDLLDNYESTISESNFFPNYEKKKVELESLMSKWEKLTISLN